MRIPRENGQILILKNSQKFSKILMSPPPINTKIELPSYINKQGLF